MLTPFSRVAVNAAIAEKIPMCGRQRNGGATAERGTVRFGVSRAEVARAIIEPDSLAAARKPSQAREWVRDPWGNTAPT
jgi:hypothetical protein